jgi:hypothetical protein
MARSAGVCWTVQSWSRGPTGVVSGLLLATGLAACGGGSPEPKQSADPVSPLTEAALPADVVRKISLRQSVYRFYNTRTGAHFYTSDEFERENILANMRHFQFDGPAFQAAGAFSPGLSPVYRFYNSRTGVHFYTISETERNNILATLPYFVLEGTAYHASQVSGQGLVPLHRFHVPARGFHFYTASEAEKNSIQANLGGTYTYEGIAYYVLNNSWTSLKLPHTGLATNQCYGVDLLTSTDYFSSCNFGGGIGVSSHQDALRTGFNPMQYNSVTYLLGQFLATHPVTSCVADGVTGLIWEGKTDDGGLRDKDNRYTNQGGGAGTDASGYVAAVNAAALCGHADWRLPTMLELHTLLDYSRTSTPALDPTWFPHTASSDHWTSDSTGLNNNAWTLYPSPQAGAAQFLRTSSLAVRLVRGRLNTSSPRYSLATVPFGSDAAQNVVNDAVSGLQWRRCLQGQTWNGSACTGTLTVYNHRSALAAQDATAGWRMPNAREARSVLEINHAPPYLNALFAAPSMDVTWTTTADVSDPLNRAYVLNTQNGNVNTNNRSDFFPVRLVRISP